MDNTNSPHVLLVKGSVFSIYYAQNLDGTSHAAKDFVANLKTTDQARLLAFIRHFANTGDKGHSKTKFRAEPEGFSVFKHKTIGDKQRVRLPCFREGNNWYITHGFFKPAQSNWPKSEIPLANKIRQHFSKLKEKEKKTG